MGRARFFLGPVGGGANMKLVVNMVMGSMMAAFSEGEEGWAGRARCGAERRG